MQLGHDSIIVGAACGLASTAVPDELMTLAGKVLIGVLVALLSGLAHSAGKALWKKLTHRKTPAKEHKMPNDTSSLN